MTNKLKYFVGNWKMFGSYDSLSILRKLHKFYIKSKKNNKIVVCVPNTLIDFFNKKFNSRFIHIGAQDCYHKPNFGPFTGSVSAAMLKNVGAKYVIIGHSEKRREGDTNKIIKQKIESAISKNLNVIFCIGESYQQKKSNKTFLALRNQIKISISKKINLNKIIIAYEPIWSIGTGKIPTSDDLKKIFKFIKSEFKNIAKTNKNPIVLYGGSVKSVNIRVFSSIHDIDGFLIGGASQSSKKFIDIIKNYYK
jgi:triosephosphate isomerase